MSRMWVKVPYSQLEEMVVRLSHAPKGLPVPRVSVRGTSDPEFAEVQLDSRIHYEAIKSVQGGMKP